MGKMLFFNPFSSSFIAIGNFIPWALVKPFRSCGCGAKPTSFLLVVEGSYKLLSGKWKVYIPGSRKIHKIYDWIRLQEDAKSILSFCPKANIKCYYFSYCWNSSISKVFSVINHLYISSQMSYCKKTQSKWHKTEICFFHPYRKKLPSICAWCFGAYSFRVANISEFPRNWWFN